MKKITRSIVLKITVAILVTISFVSLFISTMLLAIGNNIPQIQESYRKCILQNYAACLLEANQNEKLDDVIKNNQWNLSYVMVKTTSKENPISSKADYEIIASKGDVEEILENPDYEAYATEDTTYNYETQNLLGALTRGQIYSNHLKETYEEIECVYFIGETNQAFYKTQSGFWPVMDDLYNGSNDVIYEYVETDGKFEYCKKNDRTVKLDITNESVEELTLYDYEDCYPYYMYEDKLPDDSKIMGVSDSCSAYENNGVGELIIYSGEDIEHVWIYEKRDMSENYGDLFYEADHWIGICRGWYDIAIFIEIISVLIVIIGTTYLVVVAGKRGEDEEVHLRFWDKIPYGIYLVGWMFVEGFLIGMAGLLFEASDLFSVEAMIDLLFELALAGGLLLLGLLMTTVVRIKAKQFWRRTLLHYLLKPFREIKNHARENIQLFWRVLFVFLGISFVELIVICATNYNLEIEVLLFFGWKVVELLLLTIAIMQMDMLKKGGKRIAEGKLGEPIDISKLHGDFKEHGQNINQIGYSVSKAVEEQMKSERFKTELITNVSHDIKTPLTSIINYVDLIKKEEITDETLKEYIEVLDRQSIRLKKLIEDLMDASKASTGNIEVNFESFNANVLMTQMLGEYQEKLEKSEIELIVQTTEEEIPISVDGRLMWRIMENLMNNISKYAQPGTRAFVSVEMVNGLASIVIKNTSREMLNISSEELMERFVRGDSSRNTEGSGLGLNIAQSLTELMNGRMHLHVDGDLFKITLVFPIAYVQ